MTDLRILGVPETEEELYRLLLSNGPSSQGRLAKLSGKTGSLVRDAVASMEAKGMVSRTAHQRPLLVAASPESALESLIAQRTLDLDRARAAASDLARDFHSLRDRLDPGEIVQLITGPEAIVEWATNIQRGAKEEVLLFDRPPYVAGGGPNFLELELLKQGVKYRVIYDRTALEWPGQIEQLREITGAGEEARIIDNLPTGMAISDRRLAMLPLQTPGGRRVPERILVHPSPLLSCLIQLFESCWQRATAVRFADDQLQEAEETGPDLSPDDRQLLVLLAADIKDDAIGRQLGVARRSVQRRIHKLMEHVGVSTRLQLVLHAAREGWV
jgi:predicted transcriptional regulator